MAGVSTSDRVPRARGSAPGSSARRRSVVPPGRRLGRPTRALTPAGRPGTWGRPSCGGAPPRCPETRGASPRPARMVQRTAAQPAAPSEPLLRPAPPVPSRPRVTRVTARIGQHYEPYLELLESCIRAQWAERVAVLRRRDRAGTQRDCSGVLIPHEVGVMKSIGGRSTHSMGVSSRRHDRMAPGRPWHTGRDVVRLVGPPVVALGLLISILHAPHGLSAALPSATTVGNASPPMSLSSHSSSGSTP